MHINRSAQHESETAFNRTHQLPSLHRLIQSQSLCRLFCPPPTQRLQRCSSVKCVMPGFPVWKSSHPTPALLLRSPSYAHRSLAEQAPWTCGPMG
ncbi:hypothetical protein FIBSPDRAFT_261967 [Athelia psychrophila]|uniref:Uncharacterized protein n=1 Tax=Athelia psychrophila TaxID=1759441 RepID=A0A165XEM8_9AGAM|nr:hypothetical protein FIBSPDRAFT_261967 [Fibularhizoctonia sp. CBS 109695]